MSKKQKRTRTVICSFIIIAIIATVFLSIKPRLQTNPQSRQGYDAAVIRLNYTTAYGSALMQLLKAQGSIEAALPDGVRVEWVNSNAPSDTRDAMISGYIDIASLAQATAISSIENGIPLVFLSNSVFQSSGIYSCNPDIKNIGDIRNIHKISTLNLIGTSNFALMLLCKELYNDPLKLNDTMIVMGYADAFSAIEKGNTIDCAVFPFPNSKLADGNKRLALLVDLTPTIRKYELGNIIVARQEFYNNNPALIAIFMKAAQKAIDFMNEHPREAAQLLWETYDFYSGLSVSDLEKQMRATPPTLMISESAYNTVAELMHKVGIIPNPPIKFSGLPNYDSIPKVP